jgi:hypothetical protein
MGVEWVVGGHGLREVVELIIIKILMPFKNRN